MKKTTVMQARVERPVEKVVAAVVAILVAQNPWIALPDGSTVCRHCHAKEHTEKCPFAYLLGMVREAQND